MIAVKDLHMQETVKAAVEYIDGMVGFANLRKHFNQPTRSAVATS